MPNKFYEISPEERANLLCENNALRKGLVMAESQLSYMFTIGKPSDRCEKIIEEIQNCLHGRTPNNVISGQAFHKLLEFGFENDPDIEKILRTYLIVAEEK